MVTPRSLLPERGGRVKTDRRDSRKLASLLAAGYSRGFMTSVNSSIPISLLHTASLQGPVVEQKGVLLNGGCGL